MGRREDDIRQALILAKNGKKVQYICTSERAAREVFDIVRITIDSHTSGNVVEIRLHVMEVAFHPGGMLKIVSADEPLRRKGLKLELFYDEFNSIADET